MCHGPPLAAASHHPHATSNPCYVLAGLNTLPRTRDPHGASRPRTTIEEFARGRLWDVLTSYFVPISVGCPAFEVKGQVRIQVHCAISVQLSCLQGILCHTCARRDPGITLTLLSNKFSKGLGSPRKPSYTHHLCVSGTPPAVQIHLSSMTLCGRLRHQRCARELVQMLTAI